MKNLFKIVCFVTVFIPTMVLAGNSEGSAIEERCAMYITPQNKVNLAFIPASAGVVKVKIYDAQSNELIMMDKIRSVEGFNRTYNLDRLHSGNYLFEVVENDNFLRKEFKLTPPQKEIVPIVDLKRVDEKAKLAVYGASGSIQVNIYDQNHNLIYKDLIEESANFKRDYDLKAIGNNRLIFEVISNQKLIKQSFI